MSTGLSLLSESELHGLVDGHLEADRRSDVLRRLAASAPDRALVEAWQEQSDLIRSAFRDIEHEALPVALDLAPPRLRCIDGASTRPAGPLRDPAPVDHRKGGLAAAATLVVVAVGLVATWMIIVQASRDDAGPETAQQQTTLETTLADRAAAAVDPGPVSKVAQATTTGGGLPAVRIPDLTTSGFMLTSVSTQPTEPVSIVLRYSDGGDGRVAVSAARMPQDAAPSAPVPLGRSFTWRRRDAAFAIAGTLPADRLRAIAATLQDDSGN